MVGIDLVLLPLSLVLAYALKFSNYLPIDEILKNQWLFYLIPVIIIPLFVKNGLYRSVLKYMGYQVILSTMKAITIASTIVFFIITFSGMLLPGSIILIFWFVSILIIVGSRYMLKAIVYYSDYNKRPVGIYGAGNAGAQLVDNLKTSNEYFTVALFDDEPHKWGTVVNSLWVFNPEEMAEVIQEKGIKLILLAITTLTDNDRKRILRKIANYPVEVRLVTSMENIISGDFNLDHVRKWMLKIF